MMTEKIKSTITDKFPLLTALLVIFCGGMVILGQALDIPLMMQILPIWMPMKANAAVCFVLIGSAIILSAYLPATLNAKAAVYSVYLGRFLASLAGLFSLLTTTEYLFNVDLGIDQLIFHPNPENHPAELNPLKQKLDAAFPARIKLEAALCYVLLSAATLLIRSDKNHWRIASASMSLFALAIALASLSSYFTPEFGQFGWFGYGIMRMNAAVLFTILAIAILLLNWQRNILSWSLSANTTLAFTLGLFLLVIIGFNSSRTQYWLNDTNYEIALNEKVINQAESLLANVTNTQSNTRGYVITGNKRFLNAFLVAKASSIAGPKQISANQLLYKNRFGGIEVIVNQQLQWYQHLIDLSQKDLPISDEMIFHGADMLDNMRRVLLQIKTERNQHIMLLKQKLNRVSGISHLMICLGTLVSVMIFLIILFRLNYLQNRRTQAESALKASEEHFRTLFDQAPVGIALIDSLTGQIYKANQKYADIVGLTLAEIHTIDWMKITHPEDVQTDLNNMALLNSGQINGFVMEKRYLHGNGSIVWVNLTVTKLPIQEHGHPCHHCIVEDITERKQAEQVLLAKQKEVNYLRELMDSVPGFIFIKDRNLNYVHANHSFCDLVKIPHNQIKGKSDYDIFPADLAEKYIADDKRVMASGQPTTVEEETIDVSSKQSFTVATRKLPWLNEAGEICGIYGLGFDISELKQTEKELRDSKNFFELLAQISPIGIYQTDASGKCIFVNAKSCEIIGLNKEQALGSGWGDTLLSVDRERLYQEWEAADREQRTSRLEYRIRRANGTVIWVYGLSTPMYNEHGQISGYIGTLIDISDRKQAEAELSEYHNHLEQLVAERTAALSVAKDNAEAANRAKSLFIANMSHELRTPLNAILGFSGLMSQDETISAKQKESLAIIYRSGLHLLNMINDVLNISKIEAGRLELETQAFDLLNLLHDLGNMIKVRAANQRLNFRLEISPDVPQYIQSDSGKLRHILINLLENALKFTTEGQIILRTHALPLSVETRMMLEIEVIDSGCGIASDQLENLFKPFVQLARRDAGLEGTGLGLAMSKSLVELMNGRITVSTVLGVGSTFKIQLPVALADAGAVVTESRYQPVKTLAGGQPAWRLLIVDDNADNRLLLETMLTQVGFQVEQAVNGEEAIEKFLHWRPALCWMDMRMPVMDGYQATAKIRQLPGGDRVKIIAITASAFQDQLNNILEAGCDAVIHKPFQAAEVFTALSQYLGVKFVYQNQPETSSSPTLELAPEMLAELPSDLQKQLHEAALNLDVDETEAAIEGIRAIAPELAEALQKLAECYQFEQIIRLIERRDSGDISNAG